MSPKHQKQSVDLVIPVYNEAGVVEQTHAHICAVIENLPYDFTFYYVDDGSDDGTPDSLKSLDDARVKVLELSRNFGHQAALTAGMDATQGDIVITMDGDGQHPPEMIPEMINLVKQGYDVVQTQRVDEAQPASFKKWTSGLFYRLINSISGTRSITRYSRLPRHIPPGGGCAQGHAGVSSFLARHGFLDRLLDRDPALPAR